MRTLNKPFDVNYKGPLYLTTSEQRALEVEKQKTLDTDGDGLTDYDELYVYRTSPYLKDTDGDGYPDNIEVAGTSNPNGGDKGIVANTKPDTSIVDNTNSSIGPSFYIPVPDVASLNTATDGTASAAGLENVTAAQIRAALVKQGATEAQLRYYTDQQLLDRYKEVLKQSQTDAANAAATSNTTNPPTTTNP